MKYRVRAEATAAIFVEVEIEADSEAEAERKMEEMYDNGTLPLLDIADELMNVPEGTVTGYAEVAKLPVTLIMAGFEADENGFTSFDSMGEEVG